MIKIKLIKRIIYILILFFSFKLYSSEVTYLQCNNKDTKETFLFTIIFSNLTNVEITELDNYGYKRKYKMLTGDTPSYIYARLDPDIEDEFQKGEIVLNRVNGEGIIQLYKKDNSKVVKTFSCQKVKKIF